MALQLHFKSVVITGASSGIGAALAVILASPGTSLLLIARNTSRLAAVRGRCEALGADVETIAIDVADTARLADAIATYDVLHAVDLVIACAGIEASLGSGRTAEALDGSLAQIRVNLEGVVATVTPLLEPMRRRRSGTIVLISSLAALEPLADQPIYSATKAAVAAWGEALRPWLRRSGVTLTVAYPGFVATGMTAAYRGPRPFEVSAEDAAARIVTAARRGRSGVAFPWRLAWLTRLGRLAPRWLRDRVIDRWFGFEIVP